MALIQFTTLLCPNTIVSILKLDDFTGVLSKFYLDVPGVSMLDNNESPWLEYSLPPTILLR
jgi:hypothetical protein